MAFRSVTEDIDTTTSHGEFLYNLFGTLAQYERSLIRERVNAGLVAARRRGRRGGRPPAIDPETVEQIVGALDSGSSKSAVCRTFKVARSTLNDTLERIGWNGAGQHGSETSKRDAKRPREQERGKRLSREGEGTCLIPSSVPGHRGGCPQVSGSDWGAIARARGPGWSSADARRSSPWHAGRSRGRAQQRARPTIGVPRPARQNGPRRLGQIGGGVL